MTWNIELLKKSAKRICRSILLSICLGSFFAFMFCPHCFISNEHQDIPSVLRYYILTFFLIWEFAYLSSKKLQDHINKNSIHSGKIYKHIALSFIIFTSIAIPYVYFRFKVIATDPMRWGTLELIISVIVIHIQYIACYFFLNWRSLFRAWENKRLEAEIMQKQKLEHELRALKNQINPHFLFNNLNTLTNIVHKDSALAEKFINQLAKIYRYILEQKSNHVIKIEKELSILQSYQFLLDIRFGKKIEIEFNEEELKNFHVAPLVLQMLIENAIKHNHFTEEKPLKINIGLNSGYLSVKNNVRNTKEIPQSFKIGLDNINQRYLILTNREINTKRTEEHFTVEIPIILNNDKYFNYRRREPRDRAIAEST